jgi:hypothetical protein
MGKRKTETRTIPEPGTVEPAPEVVESTRVITEHRVPGAAVVTKSDDDNLAELAKLGVERDGPVHEAELVIPTHSPQANAAARDNIITTREPGTNGAVGS